MERNDYDYNDLRICIKSEKSRSSYFEDKHSLEQAESFLKKGIEEHKITSISVNYNYDTFVLDVIAEDGASCITFYDNDNQVSYNYLNPKYVKSLKTLDIAGYECPQKLVCYEDDILLKIVMFFLETGKMYNYVDWCDEKGVVIPKV